MDDRRDSGHPSLVLFHPLAFAAGDDALLACADETNKRC